MNYNLNDTIVALSTPPGVGAIGVIRLSGSDAIEIVSQAFHGSDLCKAEGYTVHFGKLIDDSGRIVDECLATVFRAPRSYTKEDTVEISCHGSPYIIDQVIQLFLRKGVRLAERGEFTKRAFLHGQLDLSQAEAVADLIAADSAGSHDLAMKQLRGRISTDIAELRTRLIKFASLIELENDFGEEDVTFANRKDLRQLVEDIQQTIAPLIASFAYGNAIKKGVPVAIVGETNVGKSTLLNALLQEEKAIVSDIAGTTRDVIEDTMVIDDILFRFVDTAGIRETTDTIESLGIARTMEQVTKAKIVLYMAVLDEDHQQIVAQYKALDIGPDQQSIIILNKADQYHHSCHSYDIEEAVSTLTGRVKTLIISAKNNTGINALKSELVTMIRSQKPSEDTVLTNLRHFEAMRDTQSSLTDVLRALDTDLPSDLIAIDIRHAMNALGAISGEIYTDDLLDSIFRDFCIGK